MELGQDPALQFTRGLVDRFLQFKALQFQQDLLKRRDERYDTQLQENRLHRQSQLSQAKERIDISRERLEAYKAGAEKTSINVFGGSERKHLFDSAVNALRGINVDEKGLIFKDKSVSKENIQNRFDEYKDDIGFDSFDEQQQTQAMTNFNRAVRTMGDELNVKIDWDPGALTETPQSQTSPGTGVFQGPRTEAESTGEKPAFSEKTTPPAPVDYDRIEGMLGKDNAQMEQKAWGVIYDTWDHFPRQLQDKIRLAEQSGTSFTEIMQSDEVDKILQGIIK